MRYAYGLTSALLVGGAAISLVTGFPAGAQVAQNEGIEMQRAVPRAGAPESFADLTEQLQPAVVNISTKQRIEVQQSANPFAGSPFAGFFGRRGSDSREPQTREATSLGSGFLISADGYVVTNNHVVAAPTPSGRVTRATVEEITITLPDGNEYEAELIGTDPGTDLAVLKIQRGEPFPFVKFGDSKGARVGDWVIAIGNPFSLGGTVTSGIVSAVYRNTGGDAFNRFIQTDASINRGNSGGPLFDMQGNVIGINNAIVSPTGGNVGIGFAIPAETAAPIVAQLRSGKEIERGYLGLKYRQINDETMSSALGLSKNKGALVAEAMPDSASEKAGIKAGDVILKIKGEEITSENSLPFIVGNSSPGETLPVELLRNGKLVRLNVTLGKRPPEADLAAEAPFDSEAEPEPAPSENTTIEETLGLQVGQVDKEMARRLGVPADTEGVWVNAIDPNSDAARKLSRGSIILSAHSVDLSSETELEELIGRAKSDGREAILLRVILRQPRGGYTEPRFIAVKFQDE